MSASKNKPPKTPTDMEAMLSSAEITQSASALDAGDLLARLEFVARLLAAAPSRPTEPALLFQPAGQAVQVKSVGSGLAVGRGSACEVSLPEVPKLSRRHFEIRREDSQFILHDPGSHNGTTIEGVPGRLTTRELRDGDIIHAGGLKFVFVRGG